MKREDWGKCETIFVREDFCDFGKEFGDLISLGKFKEIKESKEKICINKDVLKELRCNIGNIVAYIRNVGRYKIIMKKDILQLQSI